MSGMKTYPEALSPVHRPPTPAAIYLRVSTESQNYSTQDQRAAITKYADVSGLHLVREYVDEGKSGLDIRRRAGLRQLMLDVQAGDAPFAVIVVYDVSRWGRFQDVDEAAYHEHTCRRAGIKVVYCAEQFQNDDSPMASLLKGIKRTMAAEYSRELSEKVFVAQCRFIAMGFKQGGHAGFGLRRLSLAEDGTPRRLLEYGESKAAVTDRVVLVQGPSDEVAAVRRIYRLYIVEKQSEAAIARLLNAERIVSEFGRPWTQAMVNSVLTNVKYTGTLAYNRRSSKLSNRRRHNAIGEWVLNDGAVPQLLSGAIFEDAQLERARRNRRYTATELVTLLQACHLRHGKVTAPIIAADPLLPEPQLIKRCFGSLLKAYELAGIPRDRSHHFVETRAFTLGMRKKMLQAVIDLALAAGAGAAAAPGYFTISINQSIKVIVTVALLSSPKRGRPFWKIKPIADVDFIITARLDHTSRNVADYLLIPAEAMSSGAIYLKVNGAEPCQIRQFGSLDEMFGCQACRPLTV